MTDKIKINLSEKLVGSLDNNLLEATSVMSTAAEDFGVNAFIVGGAIRDLLLNKPLGDLDFVIEGSAIDFCKYLQEKKLVKIIQTAEDFGTAKIVFENTGLKTDIASTRIELYPKPGHLPVVKEIGCSLEKDIQRRDFTVNSLAVAINPQKFGDLIDYTNGIADIEKKQLKILHNKSFIDDPTRIIRGLRFAHNLNFSLETHTKLLQEQYLETFNAEDICYERIKQVTSLAFSLNSPKLYNDFIAQKIYKLVTSSPQFKDGKAIYSAIYRNYDFIEQKNIWLVYLACILPLCDVQKLNFNAKEITIFSELDRLLHSESSIKNNFDIYKLFHGAPNEAIIAYSVFHNNQTAEKYLHSLKNIRTFLGGNDLKNMGFNEGKIIGETLNKILEQKINGKISTKNDEISLAEGILSKINFT